MWLPFRQRSPRQLLWIILTSSALVAIGFGILSALAWQLAKDQHLSLATKLPLLAACLIGLAGTVLGKLALNRGIKRNQWSEDALATLRKRLDRPACNVLAGLLAARCLISMVVEPFGHGTGVFIAFATPFQTSLTVHHSLRPRTPSARKDLSNALAPAKPLHSDHWGSPPCLVTK